MENAMKTIPNALLLADVLSGRPLSEALAKTAPGADEAWSLASAYFTSMGVSDHAGYLTHRTEVKAGLRRLAVEIRTLKAEFRMLNGLSAGYFTKRRDLEALRSESIILHDMRRLGKAWSPLARLRQQAAEAA